MVLGLIIYSADTVYALGCVSLNSTALAKFAKIKNIKKTKPPVSLVCSSISQIAEHTVQMDIATSIAEVYLPGPFKLIHPFT